jgi:hypothetical protein
MIRICPMLVVLFLLTGCCAHHAARLAPVHDTFQSYLVIGFNEPCKCTLPWRDKPLLTDRGKVVKLWIRSVNRDVLLKPEPKMEVHFDVVDEFGAPAPAFAYAGVVTTGLDGFGRLPDLKPAMLGSIRVRATYQDRSAVRAVYSPPIIVIQ